mgnify:CR=1 FL=1
MRQSEEAQGCDTSDESLRVSLRVRLGGLSVSESAEAQGCDTSDEEPADGLGGLYTWDWLDDAEAFVLGGDVQ